MKITDIYGEIQQYFPDRMALTGGTRFKNEWCNEHFAILAGRFKLRSGKVPGCGDLFAAGIKVEI